MYEIRSLIKGKTRFKTWIFYACALFGHAAALLEHTNKNEYSPPRMLSLVQEERTYTSLHLWTYLEGRPAYGGQLFSHLVKIAQLENPEWTVLSAQCIFEHPVCVSEPVHYTTTCKPIGKWIKHVYIEGKQKAPLQGRSNPSTQDTVTVITGEVCVVKHAGEEYASFVTAHATRNLSTYFSGNALASDLTKLSLMESPDAYVESTFEENTELQKEIYTRDEYITIKFMKHPTDAYRRCVSFTPTEKLVEEARRFFLPELSETVNKAVLANSIKCLLLSFLSDELLLETATVSLKKGLASSSLNILSADHHVRFLDLQMFEIEKPFFYSMSIKEVVNNLAYCKGEIIQNGKVFAYIAQNGVLRKKRS
ncbi:hypothetical protein NECID01_0894 [Nematocida sp. AWRm77]|nr:hypothetical protein NECID01_0894 [Nematocida sp. AWRm77]